MIDELTKQLKLDEGKVVNHEGCHKPYKDSVGKLTIGYGRNLDDDGISQGEAEIMLWNDINIAQHSLQVSLPWVTQLSEARFGCLVNMTFNLGLPTLLCFTKMLKAVQSGDYEQAAKEMESSKWAMQVGARAHRLALQMRTNVWQFAP
jgi:lysozyme